MNAFSSRVTLQQPPRIVFGAGCAEDLPAELTARGVQCIAMVATEGTLRRSPHVRDSLRAKGIRTIEVTAIPPEPTVADFQRARETLRREKIDAVVGCGGGSVLDVAKLLAALHDRDEPLQSYFGNGLLPGRKVKLYCLPTTAGSGSEVSPNAILLDEAARAKKAVISPYLIADAAYVDPQLTLSAPPDLTAATGMDALVHCIEAYANVRAHVLVDAYALKGVQLIGAHLAETVRNGQNLEARSAVALGSLYGGLCLGPVNTAAVHALAYPLGSVFRIAHGVANAVMLPYVLRFNLPAAPERYAQIARALGLADQPGGDLATAEAGLRRIESLARACGLPTGLRDLGLTQDAIPTLVAGAMQVTRLLQNNVRPVSASEAQAIFEAAF
jgi:alcohol dehydrogenase